MRKIIRVVLLLSVLTGYGAYRALAQKTGMRIGPHVIVYKTRGNYKNLVPVELSADKSRVISYPAPTDLKSGTEYMLPVRLRKGYLLDKRGIGRNTAFLKITYKQYAARKDAPTLEEMYKMIVDKNPFTEYYDCGIRYKFHDLVKQLNSLIDRKMLKSTCKLLL